MKTEADMEVQTIPGSCENLKRRHEKLHLTLFRDSRHFCNLKGHFVISDYKVRNLGKALVGSPPIAHFPPILVK